MGQYGSNNDSGVLKNSELGKKFESGAINLPPPRTVNSCSFDPLPYFLAGDKMLSLKTWLLRPYPGNLSRTTCLQPETVQTKKSN